LHTFNGNDDVSRDSLGADVEGPLSSLRRINARGSEALKS
jgi:hypothetical protein